MFQKYSLKSTYIPYGSHVVEEYAEDTLSEYHLSPYKYSMLIARLEPENSIEIILDGVQDSNEKDDFIVIGNHQTKYGRFLQEKYKNVKNIRFLGGIYDINKLNNLRFYSNLYFHGHTVGGTNPSLLEAMGSGALICANDNVFNRSILEDDAFYFNTKEDVQGHLDDDKAVVRAGIIDNNYAKIKTMYSWERIVSQYETLFQKVLSN
jgi:glycosyltransferase involved in cell wall biosynthesis